MVTPTTFSGPRASAATVAVRAESMPPDRPTRAREKAALADVIPRSGNQGVIYLFHRPHHRGHGPSGFQARTVNGAVVRYRRRPGLANFLQDGWVFLAGQGRPQPRPEDRFNIQVYDQQVLGKGGATGNDLAGHVADQAGAVEDQFVLPTHHVQVGHKQAVVGGAGGNHFLPVGSPCRRGRASR